MMTEMKKEGNVLITQIRDNRLDAEAAIEFKEEMIERINNGEKYIVLNLSSVDFIDSSGLGAIVSIRKELGSCGELVISGTQEAVMTMFKLTRMDKVFQILPSDEEALRLLLGTTGKLK